MDFVELREAHGLQHKNQRVNVVELAYACMTLYARVL